MLLIHNEQDVLFLRASWCVCLCTFISFDKCCGGHDLVLLNLYLDFLSSVLGDKILKIAQCACDPQ